MGKTKYTREKMPARHVIMVSLVALVILTLLSYLVDPYDPYWKDYYFSPGWIALRDTLYSYIYVLLLTVISFWVDRKLDDWLTWEKNSGIRLFVQTLLQTIIAIISVYLMDLAYVAFFLEKEPSYSREELRLFSQFLTSAVILSLLIMAGNIGYYFLTSWKKTATLALELEVNTALHKQAATEAELYALRLQIDPHFVFNNLSVLAEQILQDQQKGFAYAENFAKVYRYLLVNSKKDKISVAEELRFLESYLFLTRVRIGSGISFNIDLTQISKDAMIPPMALQLLVENAIKHNRTVKSDPLLIEIKSPNGNEILVSNELKPLLSHLDGTGIGLGNIKDRYRLLHAPEIVMTKTDKHFTVILPLLK
ncbi:sensor histidine kinase [Pedobacter sp. KACC 23697]|uniref:Histidine kinase n=1 Tax=Pedobacter sp. KACC 23697 TaxID=3149230 RepID=A0AAU7K0F5_9SPHI